MTTTKQQIPRRYLIALVAILMGGILLSAYRLNQVDSWFWSALLIGGIMAISIPLARWQHNSKKSPLSAPWPAAENSDWRSPIGQSNISMNGSFKWTEASFKRIAKAWVQHTPAGRRYRNSMWFMTLLGLAGAILALVFLFQKEATAWVLLVASALLLAFTYLCKIRTPTPVRSQAEVQWHVSQGKLVLVTAGAEQVIDLPSALAVVRTPAGFIIWPSNPIETVLPLEAFATPDQVEIFSETVRSQVRNYVHAT